jgi:hypothetical protein
VVQRSSDCGVEGRATRHARRPAALLGVGDSDGADTADGFPPGARQTEGLCQRHLDAAFIMPPRSSAVPSATAEIAPTKRDRHLQLIAERGRRPFTAARSDDAPARRSLRATALFKTIGVPLSALILVLKAIL